MVVSDYMLQIANVLDIGGNNGNILRQKSDVQTLIRRIEEMNRNKR